MKNNRYISYVLVIVASLSWAASYSVVRDLVKYANPFMAAFIRSFISLLFFLLIILIQKKQLHFKGLKDNFRILLAMALTGITGNYLFATVGMQYVDAGKSALLNAINPSIIILLGALILKEPINRKRILGIVISFIGVLIVIFSDNQGLLYGIKFYPHDLLILFTAVFLAFFTIFNRLLGDKLDYYIGLFWYYLLGTVFLLPWALPYFKDIVNYGFNQWLQLLFLGLICGAICSLFWYMALMVIGAGNCSLINSFMPVFAIIIAWLFLGEKITSVLIIGSIILVFGIWQGVSAVPIIDNRYDEISRKGSEKNTA